MTEQQYIEQVDALMRSKCGHPLMPTLQRGWSKVNVMYLKAVLKVFSPPARVNPTPDPTPERRGDAEAAAVPFGLKVLYIRKSKLFGERASLSNKMCDLPEGKEFDRKRARYSDEIQSVQRDIEAVMREIADVENGEMRDFSEKPDLPNNEADLLRKLNSLRASRSRQRGIEKTAKNKQLEKCRIELKRLEKLITDVETALSEDFG